MIGGQKMERAVHVPYERWIAYLNGRCPFRTRSNEGRPAPVPYRNFLGTSLASKIEGD